MKAGFKVKGLTSASAAGSSGGSTIDWRRVNPIWRIKIMRMRILPIDSHRQNKGTTTNRLGGISPPYNGTKRA